MRIPTSDLQGIFRIIQSILPQSGTFKMWLAEVDKKSGADEIIDRELMIDRLRTHLQKGYSANGLTESFRPFKCEKN